MLGDYFNEHGEEDNLDLFWRNDSTKTPDTLGFEIWGVGWGENGEPYVYISKKGMWNTQKHEPDINPTECRISLLEPKYIQYDEKLSKEELQWFIEFLSTNWNHVIDTSIWTYEKFFNYGSILKPGSVCPDYSTLETID